jgi:hypothetical protein
VDVLKGSKRKWIQPGVEQFIISNCFFCA